MRVAYVGLGANLGDLRRTLESALAALHGVVGVCVTGVSGAYRSAPVDAEGPDYLNAVARIETTLTPLALLDALQAIEQGHGRERPYLHAPRTLDLDLLLYGDQIIDLERLTVPHPRLHRRAFVLRPLLELDRGLAVQGLGPLVAHDEHLADQVLTREALPLHLPFLKD